MLKAIIIEDEPNNAQALSQMLTEFCEGVVVLGIADNVKEGVRLIKAHTPDVVFSDIELPGENGFALLEYFEDISFEIVFTTAYDQYAVKAFEFSAVDYLLKPIQIKQLRLAIEKVKEKRELTSLQNKYQELSDNLVKPRPTRLGLPTMEGLVFVNVDDIIRCEGENNYTTFFFVNGTKILVSRTLLEYEKVLEGANFFRAHRSHLVNLMRVKKLIRTRVNQLVMEDNSVVEVSVRKRDALLETLAKL